MITFEQFDALTEAIAAALNVEVDLADEIAAAIGDTPDIGEDGLITATVRGTVYTLPANLAVRHGLGRLRNARQPGGCRGIRAINRIQHTHWHRQAGELLEGVLPPFGRAGQRDDQRSRWRGRIPHGQPAGHKAAAAGRAAVDCRDGQPDAAGGVALQQRAQLV